jgi:hypothetical protein
MENKRHLENKRNKEIASEILKCLGGNKFIAMTGAKNLAFDGPSLSFRIGRNASKVNYVKIKLNSMDTYTVTFGTVRKFELKVVEEFPNVYNDELRIVFKRITGMNTSL